MKLVYTAGKYTDDCSYKVHKHINRAWDVAVQVMKLGAYAVCPHTNSEHMEGVQEYQFFIEGTLELMRRCDAVMIIPGTWETSSGTKGEIAEAERLGLPVFYHINDLSDWLQKQKELEEMEEPKLFKKIRNFIHGNK